MVWALRVGVCPLAWQLMGLGRSFRMLLCLALPLVVRPAGQVCVWFTVLLLEHSGPISCVSRGVTHAAWAISAVCTRTGSTAIRVGGQGLGPVGALWSVTGPKMLLYPSVSRYGACVQLVALLEACLLSGALNISSKLALFRNVTSRCVVF